MYNNVLTIAEYDNTYVPSANKVNQLAILLLAGKRLLARFLELVFNRRNNALLEISLAS